MKKNSVVLVIGVTFFSLQIVSGQGWEQIIDSGGHDITNDMQVNQENKIFLLGESWTENLTKRTYLSKRDEFGQEVWTKLYYFSDSLEFKSLVLQDDGTILLFGIYGPNPNTTKVLKLDSNGDSLWMKSIVIPEYENLTLSNPITTNGDIILTGNIIQDTTLNNGQVGNIWNTVYLKINNNAEVIWSVILDLFPYGWSEQGVKLSKLSNNDFLMIVWGVKDPFERYRMKLIRINEFGEITWIKEYGDDQYNSIIYNAIERNDSSIVFAGRFEDISIYPTPQAFIKKINKDGDEIQTIDVPLFFQKIVAIEDSGNMLFLDNQKGLGGLNEIRFFKSNQESALIWDKIFTSGYQSRAFILQPFQNGYLILGRSTSFLDGNDDFYLIKTDSNGNSWTNWIEGNIYYDENEDCQYVNYEERQKDIFVEISGKGNFLRYTLSDSLGNYQVKVDTGKYIIKPTPINNYWQFCPDSFEINLASLFDTVQVSHPMNAYIYCPYLETDISTPFLRRCSTSTYYINYCNTGTISADTPYIEITLDNFLNFLNSSIPPTSQNGNVYTFDLDTIGIGECGQFTIEVEVDCDADLGQTHCVEAHIYPDSLCVPAPSWSGASIEVNGVCINDTIHFSIKNDGNSQISPGLEFIVIEDDVILYTKDINQLTAGGVQEISIENIGATYRLEADQEPNHPGNSRPTYIIEGCGQGFTPGFVNQFPMDDADPFIDIDCRENIGSYDPNDKQAFPTGFDDAHYIEQNIDIEYLIRFQNTGTDTAFRVVIRDTLSPFLDVTSVRLGASSHPYEFDISGSGILKFTFDNILLPDSTTNEPASHGFIKYRISQKENVPLGSVINNSAAIYFDFNAPVITNTTFHTVGEDFVPMYVSVNTLGKPAIFANVFPNPFSKTAIVELNGINDFSEKTFLLFNSTGQLMQEFVFENNRFEINGEELINGIYYFKINNNEDGILATGKVVVIE